MKSAEEPRVRYVVLRSVAEAPGVRTLFLAREDEGIPVFTAGQFITVYFPELGTPQGKSYSVSSAPCEKTFTITVKEIGPFSRRLNALRPGEGFEGSLPYGYFFSDSSASAIVMAAAGIGVAPFRSMIVESLTRNPERALILAHGVRTWEERIFGGLFEELGSAHGALRVRYFVTRQDDLPSPAARGRMTAERLLGLAEEPAASEFFLCGSISFVRDIWRGLRASGITEGNIYTEAFFSH